MKRLAVVALLASCSAGGDIVVGDLREVVELPATPNRQVDVLFVIDNSSSMADKQAQLAANFPRMIAVLDTLDIGSPDLHIGVVTSDLGTSSSLDAPGPPIGSVGVGGCSGVGDDGALQHASPALDGSFISYVKLDDGTEQKNFTGDLETVFAQIAQVGDVGCGFEQHLAAMQRALTNPVNDGFLRPGANLAVVILADEDDCSALHAGLFSSDTSTAGPLDSYRCTRFGVVCDPDDPTNPHADQQGCRPRADSDLVEDVQPFIDQLIALKGGDERRVMVATIAGDAGPFTTDLSPAQSVQLAPSCTYTIDATQSGAAPAVRLAAFADAFPGRSATTSICAGDLSGALVAIGETTKLLVGDPCLSDTTGLTDADASTPGLQPACETLDIRDSDPGSPSPVPACDASHTSDCYDFAVDAEKCPATSDHLRVQLHRSHDVPSDTWTHVRCATR